MPDQIPFLDLTGRAGSEPSSRRLGSLYLRARRLATKVLERDAIRQDALDGKVPAGVRRSAVESLKLSPCSTRRITRRLKARDSCEARESSSKASCCSASPSRPASNRSNSIDEKPAAAWRGPSADTPGLDAIGVLV